MYFNDEYEGGEIVFPNQGVFHKPKAGDVALFPCGGTEYEHEVKKVTEGKRYTVAMWHTMDKDKRYRKLYPELD
jgi:predicted 2-oxoglutarate/Fe(II)-dependent dioxygenase YbiX